MALLDGADDAALENNGRADSFWVGAPSKKYIN